MTRIIALYAAELAVGLTAAALLASAAEAHTAPTGWAYDRWCCGGTDCQPIEVGQVEITPEGYLVTLAPGDHQTARREHRKLFRYDEVRQSGDSEFHACILPNSQEFRCLYVPPFGS